MSKPGSSSNNNERRKIEKQMPSQWRPGLSGPAFVKFKRGENSTAFRAVSPTEMDSVGVPKGQGNGGAFHMG
jgi:hypothetical protein